MKKHFVTSLNEFVNEKVQYLNLSDKKGPKTIAQFDDTDPKDVQKLNSVRSSLIGAELESFLLELLQTVNSEFPEIMKEQLSSLFRSHLKSDASDDVVGDLRKILIQQEGIYKFDLGTGFKNSIDKISNHYSKYFDATFFDKLAKKQLGVRPMTGPGEGLLALFTDMNFAGQSDRGDLRSSSGAKVEVKARNGRVGGTTSHYVFIDGITSDLVYVFDLFSNTDQKIDFSKKYPNLFKKKGGGFTGKFTSDIVEAANELYSTLNKKDQDQFVHLIGHAIKGYRNNVMTFKEKIGPQFFSILETIIKKKDYQGLIDYKSLSDFMGYRDIDDFEYLLMGVFPTVSKNELDKKNTFLTINFKDSTKKVFDLFRKHVHVTGAAEWHTNGTGVTATLKKKPYKR